MNKNVLKNAFRYFILYTFLSIMLSSIINTILINFNIKTPVNSDIGLLISSILSLASLIIWERNDLKGQFAKFKKNGLNNVKIIIKNWGLAFLLMLVLNFIINFIIMQSLAPNEEANRNVLTNYPLYSIISMCIITPIVEEVLFRLNLKGLYKEKNKYILASGIIFGLMHVVTGMSLSNMIYILPYSVLGFAFAKIYYETDCIYSSICAHMLHNSISILVILLGMR